MVLSLDAALSKVKEEIEEHLKPEVDYTKTYLAGRLI